MDKRKSRPRIAVGLCDGGVVSAVPFASARLSIVRPFGRRSRLFSGLLVDKMDNCAVAALSFYPALCSAQ